MQVKDRTFLITGAASGLGAATAERLVAGWGHVVLCDLNDAVEAHAAQLGQAARAVRGDVTSAADMQRAVDASLEVGGEQGRAGVGDCAGGGGGGRGVGRGGG